MRLTIIALVATLTLAACTPEQLATYERETGIRLDASLVELPDVPIRLADGREVMPDGSVTATPVAPAGSRCPQHFAASLVAGWSVTDWPKLDYIMYRESRCDPRVHNTRGRDDSYSLAQVNMKAHRRWVMPLIDNDLSRLFDPTTNLRIARRLYEMAQQTYGCGWQPWKTTKQASWCD